MFFRLFPLFFIFTAVSGFAGVLRLEKSGDKISVYRINGNQPILVENVRADHRPYIHPIVAPDGNGILTEYSPGHHKHQTGLYWGFTRVNDRDYFHNPSNGYWKLLEANVLSAEGEVVQWETIYHLLDEAGTALMEETQVWSMRDTGDAYYVDLVWSGKAHTDITISEYQYGGLFLRMPWDKGLAGEVVNSSRQKNERAEGQRAMWVDVGMEIAGRDDWGHIAIFDHPENSGFPMPWRVDNQLGVGPARSILGDWTIAAGESETFRHQFVVYTGEFNDIHLNEDWKAYSGERGNYATWIAAREEAKKAEFLTGEQAIEKMTYPDGMEVTLVTSEPQITQPMAFCWDDRGRMWIAENRDYETRRTGFSKYGDSRILILEDVDGDGKMDTKKVFLDGIPFPAAIAWGFDGLWLGAPPNLLFVPDRNHDDKADEEIEVRLSGWGIRDRHEVLNSLIWGPDGWLYGCQGYATPSSVGKPKDGGRIFRHGEAFPTEQDLVDPQFIDGGIWRYHPTKDRFEVVAHGFSNPWGLDFDDNGQAFISACVIPHAWHVIQGGIFHRQGGKHINPYVYSDIQTIVDHRHRSAHGGARVYLADLFPEKYHNRLFMANIHEHALLTDILVPKGSGFVAKHGDDTLLANDPQWIGFSIEIGPEGAVYMLDWHDADICGIDVHDKDTGRVYRLAPKGTRTPVGFNLADLSDEELVEMQLHKNDWYVRRARGLLHQRSEEGRLSKGVHQRLWTLFEEQSDPGRKLRALWALHVTGGASQHQLVEVLRHPSQYVRAWAIQLLCEDFSPGPRALAQFSKMAEQDSSAVVRLYLASALQRIPESEIWNVARGLLNHAEDEHDHNIPKMIWFGIEPQVPVDPVKALRLAANSKIPMVAQFIARRATSGQLLDVVVDTIAKSKSASSRRVLLSGMRDGLLGQRDLTAPGKWSSLESDLIQRDGELRNLALEIGQLFGSAEAGKARLTQLNDSSTDLRRRKEILQSFSQSAFPPAFDSILGLLNNPELRLSALRALASYENGKIQSSILDGYSSYTAAEKAVALQTLATRRDSARALVEALKENAVPRNDITAVTARQLRRVIGPSFVDFWGPMESVAKDKQIAMDRYRFLLTDEYVAQADVKNGKAIFNSTCAACHKMYGEGGDIGPDITGSNRANLDYILTNIIDPSSEIPEGYQLVTISTQDGRTYAGNIIGEDDQRVTLAMVGQEVVLAKSDILSRQTSPVSMMPEGQLKGLSDPQVRDLIGYLRTTYPVE